jgi:hypothetical protein
VLEAGEGKPEMVQPMCERRADDADAEIAHVGEIGESKPAGRVFLAEDHLLVRPLDRPPGPDAPLQRATHLGLHLRMPPAQLLEDGDRP